MNVAEIYEKHIKPLPVAERRPLLRKIERGMSGAPEKIVRRKWDEAAGTASQSVAGKEKPKRSIMELEGLGAEIWADVDVEQYINEMRDEWDRDQ